MIPKLSGLLAAAGLVALAAACSSSGAGGREVRITQANDGCTPASIAVTPGEKLKLVVDNKSSHDYEIEGIEGAKLEELVVPEGRTRTPGYTVPEGGGVHRLKCYVAGGVATIIELTAAGPSGSPQATQPAGTPTAPAASSNGAPDTTVTVALASYSITADKASVRAGAIRFIATNTSADAVHEMTVLRVKADGTFDLIGEVDVLEPGTSSSVTIKLSTGTYRLACLVTKGQNGSTVDHYQQGMRTDITVE